MQRSRANLLLLYDLTMLQKRCLIHEGMTCIQMGPEQLQILDTGTAQAVAFFLGHVGQEQPGPHAQFAPAITVTFQPKSRHKHGEQSQVIPPFIPN